MWSSDWHVCVVWDQEGSALSGRDMRCLDGRYRLCSTYVRNGDKSRAQVLAETRRDYPSAYAIHLYGPYSNTSGS